MPKQNRWRQPSDVPIHGCGLRRAKKSVNVDCQDRTHSFYTQYTIPNKFATAP
jgi:hypothetical protein